MDSFSRKAFKTLLLILTWYTLSTGLSLYNKQLLGKQRGLFHNVPFPAPLLMSSIQFACQTLLAKLVFVTGLAQRTNNRRMPWSEYLRLVVPNGVTTGLDIGFSNKSLAFINLSFYTMCKATVPVFLLFFAFVWGIEKPNCELLGVVLVIAAGLALLVHGETTFDMLGFGLVMTASCLSGLRFTLTQVLLQGHQSSAALGGPLEVLELLTPVMSITVLLFSLAWEELWNVLPGSPYLDGIEHVIITLLVLAGGAITAFLMVWAEYQVIKETSALTFMIAGTVKEVVTVMVAVLFLHEEFKAVNGAGLSVVILGVLLFNYYKYRKLKSAEYMALESIKDDESCSDADSKHRRHFGEPHRPTGPVAGAVGTPTAAAVTAPPIPAAAAVIAATGSPTAAAAVVTVQASGGVGAGGTVASANGASLAVHHHGNYHTSHHAASGLLGRALAGVMTRNAGVAGSNGVEMSPLLAPAGRSSSGGGAGGGHDVGGGGAAATAAGRDSDIEGRVIGMGNAGDDPIAALALSGAGISGPGRGQRPGRGLTPDDE